MPRTLNKKRIVRYLLGLLVVVFIAAAVIYSQRNAIASALLDERIESIEKRLGLSIDVDGIDLRSFSNVDVADVSVFEASTQRFLAEDIAVVLEDPSFSLKSPKPMSIHVKTATVFLKSDGAVAGLVDDVKSLAARRTKPKKKAASKARQSRGRVRSVTVDLLRFVDRDGWGEAALSKIKVEGESFRADLTITKPLTADCTLIGDLAAINVECSKPVRFGDERLGYLTISAARLERNPQPSLAVFGVGIELSERVPSIIRSVFGGLKADLRVVQPENPYAAKPIALTLVLPDGGRIEGDGQVSVLGGHLKAAVEKLQFGKPKDRARGRLTGNYELSMSLPQKKVELSGVGKIEDFAVRHAALASEQIGPFDMELGGELSVQQLDEAVEVKLTNGVFGVGAIKAAFSVFFGRTPENWRVVLDGNVPSLPFKELAASVPTNLLPHIEGIAGKGDLSGKLHLLIDSKDFEKTELEIDIDTRKFNVTRLPKKLKFAALRHVYKTQFEMPEDEDGDTVIYERRVGPGTERFVPLDEMTPLLAYAVMAQEDASFRRHKGISLFHLRGSLVDNLKKGRFVRGGSTVTMQLARNLFLNRKKTISRKLEEIIVAWLLEKSFDKDELMSLYLNVVEFGPDIFGVREASDHYFGLHPKDLSAPQVAWLIKLLPGPRLYYAQFENKRLKKGFKDNLNWLMRHMIRKEFMDESEYAPVTETSLFDVDSNQETDGTPVDGTSR